MVKNLKLGDKAWFPRYENIRKTVVCPECFGKKYLTVILGDDSRVTIACRGCSQGFDPPRGYIEYYAYETAVKHITIDGMEILRGKETNYKFNLIVGESCYGCQSVKQYELYATKEEAEEKVEKIKKAHNASELVRIHRKGKHDGDWAWHVHYWRDQIRRAEKDIARNKKRLDYANKLFSKQVNKEIARQKGNEVRQAMKEAREGGKRR